MKRWLGRRIAHLLLALLAGGIVALVAARFLHLPAIASAITGMLLGTLGLWAVDLWRSTLVMQWLQDDDAPARQPDALTGAQDIWSELSRRAVRLMRLRERRVESAQAQLQQFLSAMQAAPTGILLLDEQQQVTWGNASAASHLGLQFPRDGGQHITHLVRQPEFIRYMAQPLPDAPLRMAWAGQPGTLLLQVIHYGERQRLLLTQDITEHERVDRIRRDFIANVSHEMCTPLTVLAGFVQTMRDLPLDDAARRRSLDLMHEQTQRMQHLMTDLLTLARLEGSPPPAEESRITVHDLMQQAEHTARALAAEHHALHFSAVPADVNIIGEPPELLSALHNLVGNAIRHTPPGSRIRVDWQLRRNGEGLLCVQDDGPGIAREHLPRLTERFYRVDRSRTRQSGGTGLGLSIVRHVMQRHQGALDIESTPGKGSCFTLRFPAARIRTAPP